MSPPKVPAGLSFFFFSFFGFGFGFGFGFAAAGFGAGFFASGQIGPVGGRSFLHSHAASLMVFRPDH